MSYIQIKIQKYIYIYIYINTYTPHTHKYKTLYQQPTSISGFALKLGAKEV